MFRRVFDRRFLACSLSPRRGLQHVQRNHNHNGIQSRVPTKHDELIHPLFLPVMFVLWLGCSIEQIIRDNRNEKILLKKKEEARRLRAEYIDDLKEMLKPMTGSDAERAYRDILRFEKEAKILDGRPIGPCPLRDFARPSQNS